jgi:hypothetical protein
MIKILEELWRYHGYDLTVARGQRTYGMTLLEDAIKLAKEQEKCLCQNTERPT